MAQIMETNLRMTSINGDISKVNFWYKDEKRNVRT